MENYFKVKITKHTQLLFCSTKCDMFHSEKVGDVILVKKTQHNGAFLECKTGDSILKTDVMPIAKGRTI